VLLSIGQPEVSSSMLTASEFFHTSLDIVSGPLTAISLFNRQLDCLVTEVTVSGPTDRNSLPDYLHDPSLSLDSFGRFLKIVYFLVANSCDAVAH